MSVVESPCEPQERRLTVSAMQKAMKAENQTAFNGTSRLFTLCHTFDRGMAPSLENAYTILQRCKGQKVEFVRVQMSRYY